MSVTFLDLQDAQERRHNLLDEYVLDMAKETSPRNRLAMAKAHTTWSRWVRDFDFDSNVTTDWAGVLDYFDMLAPAFARTTTALVAGVLANIDNELLKKEMS